MSHPLLSRARLRVSLSAAEMGDLSFVDFFEISGATRDNWCSKRSGDIPKYLSTEKLKKVNHCTPLPAVKTCGNRKRSKI